MHMSDKKRSASKSTSAPSSFERYTETAIKLVRQITGSSSGSMIEGLTVFVSSFVEVADESKSIMAAFGKASAPKADGAVIRSSSDKIRARVMKTKPSLKTMWSQRGAENMKKSCEECDDAAKDVEPMVEPSSGILSDDIDPGVLSQLPPSIQAEIRMSRGDTQKTKSSSGKKDTDMNACLLYTSPSPRDVEESRMPSSA